MKRIFSCTAVMGLGLALTPWATAQAPPKQPATAPVSPSEATGAIPVDQQPTKEQLLKLFETMRVRQQLQVYLKIMPAAIQQQMRIEFQQIQAKAPGGAKMKPEQQEAMEKILDRYMEKVFNIISIDEMIDDMTGLYQRHFTRSDVDAYIAFYGTQAGQHLLDEQPVIMKEYLPMVMARFQERIKPLTDGLTADLQAYIKSQTPAATPKPKAGTGAKASAKS